MPGDVFHGRTKANAWGIRVQTNRAQELNSGLRIRRACEFGLAMLSLRKFSERVWPIVQKIRVARPVLFVAAPLGQKPELVAAVIEPLARIRRQMLAGQLRID